MYLSNNFKNTLNLVIALWDLAKALVQKKIHVCYYNVSLYDTIPFFYRKDKVNNNWINTLFFSALIFNLILLFYYYLFLTYCMKIPLNSGLLCWTNNFHLFFFFFDCFISFIYMKLWASQKYVLHKRKMYVLHKNMWSSMCFTKVK